MTLSKKLQRALALLCILALPQIHGLSAPLHAAKDSIRLVSWNLLAPIFSHPNKYPWIEPEYLAWPHRQKLIVSELQRIDSDIVCLQEIQTDLWEDFLIEFEGKYEGILQNTTNDHPVTNAILLKKNKFQVLRQESRSRALILVLDCIDQDDNQQSAAHTDRPLYLANVHLQAGMEDDKTRICQLKSLMKRMNTHVKQDKRNKDEPPPKCAIVGDFNMLPTNPIYRWLSHKQHETASIHGRSKQPLVHMHDAGTGENLSHLKFPSRGQHMELLPLKDVYDDLPPTLYSNDQASAQSHPVKKTYCGGSVLDYIWTTTAVPDGSHTTSHSIPVTKTLVFHAEAFEADLQPWPSKEHPSDHLPVGVEFLWR